MSLLSNIYRHIRNPLADPAFPFMSAKARLNKLETAIELLNERMDDIQEELHWIDAAQAKTMAAIDVATADENYRQASVLLSKLRGYSKRSGALITEMESMVTLMDNLTPVLAITMLQIETP